MGRGIPSLYNKQKGIIKMTSFDEYVDQYGPHFNKKLYEYAVAMMVDKNGGKIQPKTKEDVKAFLESHGVKLNNDKGHDAAYVFAMCKSDYWASSITDDVRLALFIKDYLDDPDGSKTKAFDHFVVDCRSNGEPIFWDEMV